jgi:hypothetical protein
VIQRNNSSSIFQPVGPARVSRTLPGQAGGAEISNIWLDFDPVDFLEREFSQVRAYKLVVGAIGNSR